MAFSSTITASVPIGDRVRVFGTYTNGTVTDIGGNVATGLLRVDSFTFQKTGSGTSAVVGSVNETFPLAGGDVTIVTNANEDGLWEAIGIQ